MPVNLATVGTAVSGLFVGLYRTIGWVLLACVAMVAAYWLGYSEGRVSGASKVAVKAVQAATATTTVPDTPQLAQAQAQVARAADGGQKHETTRRRIDARFAQITKAVHESTPPSSAAGAGADCTVPAELLQLWSQANAGPGGADPAPGESDAAAPAPADAGVGPAQGPGGEPRRDGPAVPPAGQPDVRPAGVPASDDEGV